MPALGTAREKSLGPVRGDGLEAVKVAVHVLERHDQVTAGISAQGQRPDLLGGEIGVILGGRMCHRPDPCGAGGGLRSGGRGLRLWHAGDGTNRLGSDRGPARPERTVRRRTRRRFGDARVHPEIARHADAIAGPVQGLVTVQPAHAADKIDQPAADPRLVVEPHAGLGTGDHDRQAALAAPAPFMARTQARIAQELDRKLLRPCPQLGIEGLPVPPAHRRPRASGTRAPVGPRAVAVTCRG